MNELRLLRSTGLYNAFKVASVALGLTFGLSVMPAHASAETTDQSAQEVQSLTKAEKNQIASKFMAYFPQIKVVEVNETVFEGMFELALDSGESVFVNKDANHLLVNAKHLKVTGPGQIVDVSEQRKSEGRQALLASLNTEDAVVFKGEGKKKTTPLYVFTDVDCGYCRKLHDEVPALQKAGIDVMYFAWPRAGMQSNTATKMKQVWCADDQQSAMTAAKAGEPLPEAKNNCNPPIEADFMAGRKLGVAGTPAIFLEDGRQIGGYAKAEDLLKVINAK